MDVKVGMRKKLSKQFDAYLKHIDVKCVKHMIIIQNMLKLIDNGFSLCEMDAKEVRCRIKNAETCDLIVLM